MVAITSDQATQWARSQGILNANETATGGLLDSRLKSNPYLTAEYGKFQQNPTGYQNTSAASAPGVQPLTVSGQNDYQKGALYDMGQPSKPIDPNIGANYGKATAALDTAGKPYDPNSYKQFMNPYIDEVINRNASNIKRGYDINRNRTNESFAEAGGFGSTALGTERAQLGEAEQRQVGDMDAQLRSQGYDTATQNALGLYNNDRSGNIARASAYQNVANGLQGADQYGRAVTQTDQDRKLAAGDRIQQQNQAVLDAYYAERDRQAGYPYQQLDWLTKIIGSYPTGTTQTTPGVGAIPGAIGGGLLGNAIGNQMMLPWQASSAAGNGASAAMSGINSGASNIGSYFGGLF